MGLTITEALAEVKTIGKRAEKKREFVNGFLYRQDGIKDPLEKDGGSVACVERERQALHDLETRVITLRRGIQLANDDTIVTIEGMARSITDWLIWRREVAPGRQAFLARMRNNLNAIRDKARREGVNMLPHGAEAQRPADIIVNINEQSLATDIEQMESVLGQLDGMLSLKNATVQIVEAE